MSVEYRIPDYLEKIQGLCLDIQAFIDGVSLEEFLDDKCIENGRCNEPDRYGRSCNRDSSQIS